MMNMSKKEYNRYVARLSGTSPTGKNLLNAFWVGGLICALGQLILNGYTALGLSEQDAASGWVLDELEEGNPAPKASAPESIALEAGEFISLLALDMDSYAEKYGEKAVRKNLTIPAWLNTFAEKQHVNFSQVLTDALSAMYQSAQ